MLLKPSCNVPLLTELNAKPEKSRVSKDDQHSSGTLHSDHWTPPSLPASFSLPVHKLTASSPCHWKLLVPSSTIKTKDVFALVRCGKGCKWDVQTYRWSHATFLLQKKLSEIIIRGVCLTKTGGFKTLFFLGKTEEQFSDIWQSKFNSRRWISRRFSCSKCFQCGQQNCRWRGYTDGDHHLKFLCRGSDYCWSILISWCCQRSYNPIGTLGVSLHVLPPVFQSTWLCNSLKWFQWAGKDWMKRQPYCLYMICNWDRNESYGSCYPLKSPYILQVLRT